MLAPPLTPLPCAWQPPKAICGDNGRAHSDGNGCSGNPTFRRRMRVAAMAASMGGNVRVGLEDSLWAGPGKLASSNAEQVHNARQILEGLGLEIATPDEAREILHLKGVDRVDF